MKNSVIIGCIVIITILAGGVVLYRISQNSKSTSQSIEQNTTNNNTTPSGITNINISSAASVQNVESTNQIGLSVSQPNNGIVVTTSHITVTGKTVPNAEVAVNDIDMRADSQGNFSTAITLDEGENTIIVMANDAQGNSAEKDITVTYDTGNAY